VRDIYPGDSYDLVKRFWHDQLACIPPLCAHPHFVPPPLHVQYTALTRLPILDPMKLPEWPFGLFLDPDTGIPLPEEQFTQASLLRPHYMICFDQSIHRKHKGGLNKDQQRETKRDFLRSQGIAPFYYFSHAPFLFMAQEMSTLQNVRNRLIGLGIPERTPTGTRLQSI
jgi:hypothetical protein